MMERRNRSRTVLEQLLYDLHTHSLNYHTREVYLHSSYSPTAWDDEPGVEYRTATTFIKNLHVLDNENQKNILVHLHIVGGNWSDGMAMFDTVRFTKSPITMLAYAQASSMSGILLQAADARVLMPDCEFMVHHGYISLDSDAVRVKSVVEINDFYCKRMLQIFSKRAIVGEYFKERNYSEDKIAKFIDRKLQSKGDWFMTAEEAVYYGLADGVLGEGKFKNLDALRGDRKFKGVL